jgi:hypothetical protein
LAKLRRALSKKETPTYLSPGTAGTTH